MHANRQSRRWTVAVGVVLTALLVASAALLHRKAGAPPPSPAMVSRGDPVSRLDLDAIALPIPSDLVHTAQQARQYVGSLTCAGCHPSQAAKQGRTPHEHSVRRVTLTADEGLFR